MGVTRRLLLVEDDELVRRAVARRLKRDGYDVAVAGTGAQAVANAGPFDIGVFDIDLPDANGIDVAGALLAAGTVGRAVFFSATYHPSIVARARRLGAFVEKGAGIDVLLGVLRQADREAEARARAVGSPSDAPGKFPTEPPSAVRRRT